MKPKTFISQLAEGDHITSAFLVTAQRLRLTKRGDPYLCLTLADRDGTIEARAWDNAQLLSTRAGVDDFAEVAAQVTRFNGELQLNVHDLRRIDDAAVDVAHFLPASRWDPADLLDQLRDLVSREVKSASMLRFFEEFFADASLMRLFCAAPAAKANHHAYLGGLLEHSLSMARLGSRMARHYAHYYPGLINQDLVIAGCVLHDVGKCFELEYTRGFRYSDQGQMVGHIVQGVELITEIASRVRPPLPANMLMRLKHLVLSHHGRLEYGSPIKARTPEAVLLHQIDMIDSRMAMCRNTLDEHANGPNSDEPWTAYSRLFEGALYAPTPQADQWATYRVPAQPPEGPGSIPADDAAPSKSPAANGQRADDSELNLDLFSE